MPGKLFVALWPDDAARAALLTTLDECHHTHPEVRWQPPERWHLTLAFLGQAEAATATRRIARTLPQRAFAGAGPIRLTGAGAFGPVLWAGVEHGPWLTELASELQQALHVPDRRFRAHVTVGRIRGPDPRARARLVLADLPEHAGPWWTPLEVTLVDSVTGPNPLYHVLERWPLEPLPDPGPPVEPSGTT